MPHPTFYNLPQRKRAALEAAAIEEFARHGLAAASTNAIIGNAKIPKGSFYQYFVDKEDLYQYIQTLIKATKKELAAALPLPENPMDTFEYLRWLLELEFLFARGFPQLARIEQLAFLENPLPEKADAQSEDPSASDPRFQALLAQGIVHEDIATWVDAGLGAHVLELVTHLIAPYLINRLDGVAKGSQQGSTTLTLDEEAQSLLDNLMEILEAGMARDPQVRKNYYTK